MRRLLPALAIVLFSIVSGGVARAQMPAAPAFVMEARVGGGLAVAGGGNGGGGASANLTFGVRLIDRLQIGLGFSVFHTSTIVNTTTGAVNAQTIFTINPTLTIDILKARDNKVAWYGKIGLPLGAQVQAVTNNVSSTVFVIGYDLGLGVRYCPHPNVAFGVEGGLDGFYADPGNGGSTGTTGVYGAIVGTFYWGKGT